jgi:superfamily I DNA/RNA helicase
MNYKPRLVRGVAGSGKTIVLVHWLVRYLEQVTEDFQIWVVYTNRSLHGLLRSWLNNIWCERNPLLPLPQNRVKFFHILDILRELYGKIRMRMPSKSYEYDTMSERYMMQMTILNKPINAVCDAIFIDEAQDMGFATLKLLNQLVRQQNSQDINSKPIMIFYDDAQNIYQRSRPRWVELGIDVRGRSSVLKENFRSTQPIAELALNVFYKLQFPDNSDTDYRELLEQKLISETKVNGKAWWKVHFAPIDGPIPTLHISKNLRDEIEQIHDQILYWIREQHVKPSDIKILYLSDYIKNRLQLYLTPPLKDLGIQLLVQASEPFSDDENALIVSTPHSFKGYDSEIILIAGLNLFATEQDGILIHALYVAMTRARSILAMFGHKHNRPLHIQNTLLFKVKEAIEQLTLIAPQTSALLLEQQL